MSEEKSNLQILQEQLAARKEKTAEQAKQRDEKLEEKWCAVQLQALELEENYEAKFGARGDKWDMYVPSRAHCGDTIVVVRKPDSVAWNAYEDLDADKKTKTEAHHLILKCLEFPGSVELGALSKERPVVIWDIAALIARMAGLEVAAEAKK